ncbi:MAG TPA: hypothetical protein VII96_12235 [Acidimicrobiales bacterium]
MTEYPGLLSVIAGNVRRLRTASPSGPLSQEGLASAMRLRGVLWTRATVAAVETTRRSVSLIESIALADCLGVGVTGLVEPETSHVAVDAGIWSAAYLLGAVLGDTEKVGDAFQSEELRHLGRTLTRAVRGARSLAQIITARWGDEVTLNPAVFVESERQIGDTETAVADRLESRTRLGVTPLEIVVAADALWGRCFADERDRRATGRPDATPRTVQALRGRATRAMEQELREAIEVRADRASALPATQDRMKQATRRSTHG